MLTVEKFRELVEKYDRIAVFRHTNPDYDALGSQYGIVRFLRNRYPKKMSEPEERKTASTRRL